MVSTDQIHDVRSQLLDKAEARWHQGRGSESFWLRLFHRSNGTDAHEGILIEEFDDADWHAALCRGNVLLRWVVDKAGRRSISSRDELPTNWNELRGHRSRFMAIAFHFNFGSKEVLWTQMSGPLAGVGMTGAIVIADGKTRVDWGKGRKRGWIA